MLGPCWPPGTGLEPVGREADPDTESPHGDQSPHQEVHGAAGTQGRHPRGAVRVLGAEWLGVCFPCGFLVPGPVLGSAEDPVGSWIWLGSGEAQLLLILAYLLSKTLSLFG